MLHAIDADTHLRQAQEDVSDVLRDTMLADNARHLYGLPE
jgi:hypothetical protein